MTDLDILATQVRDARRRVDVRAGSAQQIAAHGKREQAEVARLASQAETLRKSVAVLTSLGEQRQAEAQRRLEELVTRGLQVIFGENLSFHVTERVVRNQAEVDFVIRSTYPDGVVETPVLEARGGGMAAVVGFMLRLVVLLLTPGARRVLFLDESFAHVSREYEPRVAEFLKEVAAKAGVQIVLVTHSDAYDDAADKRYRFALGPDGTTVVESA
jgi:hypothetical protein